MLSIHRSLIGSAVSDTGAAYRYVLTNDGHERWVNEVPIGNHPTNPFAQEIIWADANAVAVGAGETVTFLELESGDIAASLPIDGYFAGFAVTPAPVADSRAWDSMLLALGCYDVIAFDPFLRERWRTSEAIAIDGTRFLDATSHSILVRAECDPPGGWMIVTIDSSSGRVLRQRPDFDDGYAGYLRHW